MEGLATLDVGALSLQKIGRRARDERGHFVNARPLSALCTQRLIEL
jgi:hypothetical protein